MWEWTARWISICPENKARGRPFKGGRLDVPCTSGGPHDQQILGRKIETEREREIGHTKEGFSPL